MDTGGTFTDLVEEVDGALRVRKVASTPEDPAQAIVAGLAAYEGDAFDLVHGSTVATNALLERRGARTLLVVTAGFEDLLAIGRQARRDIYDLDVAAVPPLVDREAVVGVHERVAADGTVVAPLAGGEIDRLRELVDDLEPDAVAICLLHAYANPSHEERLAKALAQENRFVTRSSEVLPEFREYERCSTTTVNAYVGPVMSSYLGRLERQAGARRVRVMQSNGGAMSAATAGRRAVDTVLSGPAGGVVGAFGAAARSGFTRVLTFDMGGTSTDVSLCDGRPATSSEAEIGGLPIRVPVLDIHTVGAGGGSIAAVDRGGALRVGPRSAGAVPGPACYGRGGVEPTVTDANLVLGRLAADHFLGGERMLDRAAAEAAVDRLAADLGLSRLDAAEGVVRVADATMEGALRVISVERGHDPRDFSLVAFGGAGGLHAAHLARALGMAQVLVPPAPGILSALGMLQAPPSRHLSRTVLGVPDPRSGADELFSGLEQSLGADPMFDGAPVEFERSADLRYRGQGFELNVPWGDRLFERFHQAHAARYGYADESRTVEVVTLRVRASHPVPEVELLAQPVGDPDASAAALGEESMVLDGESHVATRYARDRLRPGNRLVGPAMVVEYTATTVVPSGWSCSVDPFATLILEPAP